GVRAELYVLSGTARALRHRDGRRMGRGRVARYGESTAAFARSALRLFATGLRGGKSPGGALLLLPVRQVGLAPHVLHRRIARAARAFRAGEGEGIRSVGAVAHCRLEPALEVDLLALEAV